MADNNPGCEYPGDCELTQALLKKAASRQKPEERGYVWKSCLPKAKPVKLFLLDVDGVLTDGSLAYTHEGREIKIFNSRDGFGLNLIRKAGIEVGLITARSSEALMRRARDLSISHVYQGERKKIESYREILAQLDLQDQEVAYMGDDWLDLPLLARVGFSVAVADAVPEVRKIVHYTTKLGGGRGAVREVCDLLIDAKGLTDTLLANYLK